MKRYLVKTDGTIVDLTERGKMTFEQIYELIGNGCDCIDVVAIGPDNDPVMCVDDNGLLKGLPVNDHATKLYRAKGRVYADSVIVGNVVFVPDSDYE